MLGSDNLLSRPSKEKKIIGEHLRKKRHSKFPTPEYKH